ncbi:MAG: arginase family protein, partial [Pedobacter sp.]
FSIRLCEQLEAELRNENFKLVLGGDCTILLGIMPALKAKGEYGLLYLDAHADFYQPDKSTTGEVADMGLAMVTGRGPEVLTNINNLKPYVRDENVIHIGQRDAEEAKSYGSQDIKTTSIKCFDLNKIRIDGLESISDEIIALTANVPVEGFWLHFDTDVISDDENPAVDYRLPGGLTFEETSKLLTRLLLTDKIVGMSVTIFNPQLDHDGEIAEKITACLSNSIIAARL